MFLSGLACAALGCVPENPPEAKQDGKPEAKPVTVRRADTLDPDEIGVGKFVFEEKVPAEKVLALRQTEERNGRKQNGVYETIQYTNGGNARQVVLVYDLLRFPFSDRKTKMVRLKCSGSSICEFPDLQLGTATISPGRLYLSITDFRKETVDFNFECFVEDYKTTKARIPKLPAASPNVTWTYHKLFEDK